MWEIKKLCNKAKKLMDFFLYSMTLTQTEKGYPQPVTHVGIPKSIREEKGWYWAPTHTAPVHYPWHKAPYLEKRKKELEKYITELDPKKPVCIFVQVTPMMAMINLGAVVGWS